MKPARCNTSLAAAACVAAVVVGGCATSDRPPAPPPKTAEIPKLSSALTMDGRLEEAVWGRAAVLSPFVHHDSMAAARVRTEVRVWYDDAALYLGWTCDDPDIQATFTARDSRFWEEEVAEFFVTPGPLERYFELQWNPLAGTFDAIITNQIGPDGRSQKFEGDWSYTATGMTYAVQADGTVQDSSDRDRLWTVEVRIPFSDFGQPPPKPGDAWRANFYRFNRDTGQEPELLSWSPTLWSGFHQPTRFGHLVFRGPR